MKKILLLALTVLLTLSPLAACSSGSGSDNTDASAVSAITVNIPKNASEEEKIAYGYIENFAKIYETGLGFEEIDLRYPAYSSFSTAVSFACSMRYAVDCLLYLSGEGDTLEDVVGDRVSDWNEIAATCWMSPYPYFFEGLTLEKSGDSAAAECYRKAALNPTFAEDSGKLKCIMDMDVKSLNNLKTELAALEDEILMRYDPWFFDIPRDDHNFSVEYMREKALACLESDENDTDRALDYFQAALLLNPFDGDSYADLVVLCLHSHEDEMLRRYLNDGLFLDPGNAKLNLLQNTIGEAIGS